MAADITTASFEELVANSDKPVLIDFWASWCGPCRAMSPIVDEVGAELSDRLAVFKCNVDDESELAQRFGIVSIPTLILFKGGEAAHTMVGSTTKAKLIAELEANL